jgi:DNA-binding HxlR family transcriptional regulator
MPSKPYGSICALSKACDALEPRWTLLILNQMWSGYSRFSELRRAVGNISPGVLSKRLSEMERMGLIERVEDPAKGTVDYVRTQMAIDLEPAMDALCIWAQRNIDADVALANSDVARIMWGYAKSVKSELLPQRRVVVRFNFSEEPDPFKTYYLLAEPGAPCDVCVAMPDLDVDLYVESASVSLSAIYWGRSTVAREIDAGRMYVSGDALLRRTMQQWLPQSYYSTVDGIRMLPGSDRAS